MKTKTTDTQQHLLDTGKSIMACKGFSAVGLSEILKTAGVPKGSFYHYFDCKEAFGEALLERYFEEYLAQLSCQLGMEGLSASDRLLGYWSKWQDAQVDDDPHTKCLVVKLGAEVCDLSESMRVSLQQGTQKIIGLLAACIQEGIDQGEFKAQTDALQTAMALYQLWLGASLLAKNTRNSHPFNAAMNATRQVLKALAPISSA